MARSSVLKLVSIAFLMLAGSKGFAQTLIMCYPDCGRYQGPMTDYDVPGGSSGLNRRNEEAYRYGYVQQLQQYQGQIEAQIVDFNKAALGENATAAQIEKLEAEVHASLLETYPAPSPTVLDESVRRTVNPLPEGMSETELQKEIDPVWNAVKKRDTVELAEQIAKLNMKMIPVAGSQDSEALEQRSVMINSEFAISEITNDQGLIRAPFAETPTDLLHTSPTTFNGADVRAGINAQLAAQSEIGKKCAGMSGAEAEACARFNAHVRGQVAAYYALDKMASSGVQVSRETRELFYSMGVSGQIALGVGRGVADGTIQVLEGIKILMDDPAGVAVAFGTAIMNFSATSQGIAKILEGKAAEFMAGNAEVRAQILSEAAVQVGALFIPGPDVAAIVEGSILLKTGVYVSMAGTADALAMAGSAVRASLVAERMGIAANKLDEFSGRIEPVLAGTDGNYIAARLAANPGRGEFVASLGEKLGAVSAEARQYTAGIVAYEGKIFGREISLAEATQIAGQFDEISGRMANLEKGVTQEVDLTRAIPSTRTVTGPGGEEIIIQNSMEDVMNFHKGGLEESHRMTRPMREGFYGSIGQEAAATARDEAISSAKGAVDLLVDTKKFVLENPLDLRVPEVREQLGITLDQISKSFDKTEKAYQTSQIIGELAEKSGFDSIIFPSVAHKGGTNVVIFRKRPNP